MKLQQLTSFLAKTISQFCMVVFLVLFVAVAEGALSVVAALALGAVNLVVLNALCGLLLIRTSPATEETPGEDAEEAAARVVYRVRHRAEPVRLRLVHGSRVA